jgi:CBS domain-containing protein
LDALARGNAGGVDPRRERDPMMLVRHVMAGAPVTASPDMNAYDAAGLMATNDIGVLPIADGDRLVGIVTDRDLVLRVLAARRDPSEVRLGDIATTKGIETVTPDAELADARALMADKRIRRLPVVKDGSLVGMLSLGDVALASASMRGVGEALAEISVSPATVQTNAGPEVGTPERVRDRAEASSRPR